MNLHLTIYGTHYPKSNSIMAYHTYTCQAVADDYVLPESDLYPNSDSPYKDFELHQILTVNVSELLEHDYIAALLKYLALNHQRTMPGSDELGRIHESIMQDIASPAKVATVRKDIYAFFEQLMSIPLPIAQLSRQVLFSPSVKAAQLPIDDILKQQISPDLQILFAIEDTQNKIKTMPFFPSEAAEKRKATIQFLQGYGRLFHQLLNSETINPEYVTTCQSITQMSETLLHTTLPKSPAITQFLITTKMLTERLADAAKSQLHEERIQARQLENVQPSCL